MRTKDFSISPVQKKAPGIKAWRFEFVRSIFEAFQFFCAVGGFSCVGGK